MGQPRYTHYVSRSRQSSNSIAATLLHRSRSAQPDPQGLQERRGSTVNCNSLVATAPAVDGATTVYALRLTISSKQQPHRSHAAKSQTVTSQHSPRSTDGRTVGGQRASQEGTLKTITFRIKISLPQCAIKTSDHTTKAIAAQHHITYPLNVDYLEQNRDQV